MRDGLMGMASGSGPQVPMKRVYRRSESRSNMVAQSGVIMHGFRIDLSPFLVLSSDAGQTSANASLTPKVSRTREFIGNGC